MLVTTFKEACKQKGLDFKTVLPDVSCYPKEHQKALIASAKLFIIVDVLNDGHKFNWNNYSEYKWQLWWDMDSPGFRFYDAYCLNASTLVAPRLCFRTRAISEHAAKYFEKEFKDLHT